MHTTRSAGLRPLFSSLLALAAAGGVAGVACSSGSSSTPGTSSGTPGTSSGTPGTSSSSSSGTIAEGDAGVDRTGFDQSVCDSTGAFKQLGQVTATPAVDYLALRTTYSAPGSDAGSTTPDNTIAEQGTKCGTATNGATCTTALANLHPPLAWSRMAGGGQVPSYSYLAYTRGNTVAAVTALADVGPFLAPIENAHDAAFIASINGYAILCPGMNAKQTAAGWELLGKTGSTCDDAGDGKPTEHRLQVSTSGALTVLSSVPTNEPTRICGIGRRPEGFVACSEDALHAGSEAGAYFARMAELEAASVPAFERLGRELLAHGAPAALVARCEEARADEVRHARVTATLAARYGATAPVPAADALPVRPLLAMALDNAAEGCVSETFGALLAGVQATRAADAFVRRTLAVIAEDETRHAELSWEIAAWAEQQLSADDRATVTAARRDAVRALRAQYTQAPCPTVARAAGLPDIATASALLDCLDTELWAA